MLPLNSRLHILAGLMLVGSLALPAQTLQTKDLQNLSSQLALTEGDRKGVSILSLEGEPAETLLVRFDPLAAGSIKISGHPSGPAITLGKWYWIAGKSGFRFEAKLAVPTLKMSIATAAKGKTGDPFAEAKQEPPAANVKVVTLSVPCNGCAGNVGSPDEETSGAPLPGPDYVKLGLWGGIGLLVVLGVFAGYKYFSGREKTGPAPSRGAGTILKSSPPSPMAALKVRSADEQLADLSCSLLEIQKTLKELAPRVARCEHKAAQPLDRQQVNVSLQDLGIVEELGRIREELAGQQKEREQLRQALASLSAKTSPRLQELDEQAGQLRIALQEIRSEAGQKLQTALGVLADVYAGHSSASADEQTLLVQRLEEELTRFFRQSVPSRDGLSQRRTRGAEIREASLRLVEALHPSLREEGKGRLGPGVRETSQIETEIEGLIVEAEQQRIQLTFSANLSASAASRESLSDAISVALQAQVQKLNDPPGHFDRRLDSVGLSLAQNAADFLDLKGDPQRLNPDVQRLLTELVAGAGLEMIDPSVGSEYQPSEQKAVQMIPRTATAASHTVVRGVSRGFRRSGTVVRKASVILYE